MAPDRAAAAGRDAGIGGVPVLAVSEEPTASAPAGIAAAALTLRTGSGLDCGTIGTGLNKASCAAALIMLAVAAAVAAVTAVGTSTTLEAGEAVFHSCGNRNAIDCATDESLSEVAPCQPPIR